MSKITQEKKEAKLKGKQKKIAESKAKKSEDKSSKKNHAGTENGVKIMDVVAHVHTFHIK